MNNTLKGLIISFLIISISLVNDIYHSCAQESTGPEKTEESILKTSSTDDKPNINGRKPQPSKPRNSVYTIFDDKMLIEGYVQKYKDLPKSILLEMIKDEVLSPYKTTAAINVLNQNYASELVGREKKIFERALLRRLNRDGSPFVQVEIMHTLLRLDRYRYFKSMAPALIQKLNHYNGTVNEMAFEYLEDLIDSGNNRTREARIVFNTLRKILFLSRKRLANITEPGPKLTQKLKLLRWSIKVLGTQELKRLPKEVINLL